ncbi:MAG: UbiX family flavin prenyltransferase [Armatimonadota bacterium]|nr:UbiX family flavin prenyltransferase [Armatimonadota bacterium]
MGRERRLFVAITGASGMVYAQRLLSVLPEAYHRVYVTASDNALDIMRDELGVHSLEELIPKGVGSSFSVFSPADLYAPPASGSHDYEGMVIVPCSVGVVGRVAAGVSNDLVTRAADVCLKERRKLVLVLRETPLNLVHIRNLALLAEAGAIVLPASPAFYHKPQKLDDVVDYVVDKILCVLNAGTRLMPEWCER